jgi:type IV secretion system protein TrbE
MKSVKRLCRPSSRCRRHRLFEWTLRLLKSADVPLTEVVQRYVSGALRTLARRPARERTITGLITVMVERPADMELMRPKQTEQRHAMDREKSAVRNVLREYTAEGAHGGLLDASEDGLGEGWLHTFEQKTLLSMPRLVGPVTNLLFHRQEQRFDTRHPMLVIMDDAAVAWALPEALSIYWRHLQNRLMQWDAALISRPFLAPKWDV